MMMDRAPATEALAAAGGARVSYGPAPCFKAMARLAERYREIANGA